MSEPPARIASGLGRAVCPGGGAAGAGPGTGIPLEGGVGWVGGGPASGGREWAVAPAGARGEVGCPRPGAVPGAGGPRAAAREVREGRQ